MASGSTRREAASRLDERVRPGDARPARGRGREPKPPGSRPQGHRPGALRPRPGPSRPSSLAAAACRTSRRPSPSASFRCLTRGRPPKTTWRGPRLDRRGTCHRADEPRYAARHDLPAAALAEWLTDSTAAPAACWRGDRQPALAASFRRGTGAHARRLRHDGRPARPSRTARMAGRRARSAAAGGSSRSIG